MRRQWQVGDPSVPCNSCNSTQSAHANSQGLSLPSIHPSTPTPSSTAAGPAIPPGQEPDLGMRVLLVDGDETIADSAQGGLAKASETFKQWIATKWPAKEAVAA